MRNFSGFLTPFAKEIFTCPAFLIAPPINSPLPVEPVLYFFALSATTYICNDMLAHLKSRSMSYQYIGTKMIHFLVSCCKRN